MAQADSFGQANLPTRPVNSRIVNPSHHVNNLPQEIVSSAELSIPTESALSSDFTTSNNLLMKLTFWLM